MRPKLLFHVETDQAPCTKRQAFGAFQKITKTQHENQKPSWEVSTSLNVLLLRAACLVLNRTVKAKKPKKPFTAGEKLILLAAESIRHGYFGEAEVGKGARAPLLAGSVAGKIDETAVDTEAQLLERINGSLGG